MTDNEDGGTTLLIVDPQNDFHPGGSLAIPKADEDAERIAALIRDNVRSINRVVVTLDSHHKLHIANPCFWESGDIDNVQPDPFTIISCEDIKQGKWRPRSFIKLPVGETNIDPEVFGSMDKITDSNGKLDLKKYAIEYTRLLEEKGLFKLCIWPEHCLIATPGHNVVPCIREALEEWSGKTGSSIEWEMKGQPLLTESYSALKAEVPICSKTSFKQQLQDKLLLSDRLLVCGQAKSHCVNYTLRDILDHWPEEDRSKITLLTDCSSAVPGFEDAATKFEDDMKSAGVNLCTASQTFTS
mmetsp:Transcript_5958/g.8428  ORF Transcript_5958/g.8428 Transcript_5958/m.8428 type:complete len:299 (-) Transcript_5958:131-1027(-)